MRGFRNLWKGRLLHASPQGQLFGSQKNMDTRFRQLA
jgi:hypothetical protein